MTKILEKIEEKVVQGFLALGLIWVTLALTVQVFFVYLQFSGQEDRAGEISNKVSWKIDGTFKNDPDNIWYEGPKK
jgi:hypothetical protein